MGYLSDDEINDIMKSVELLGISEINTTSFNKFDAKIEEYNDFLDVVDKFDEWNISRTHFLIHNKTKELIGYMTLSTDSIKLTGEEKDLCHMSDVPFASIPAIKVGKLAINKKLSKLAKRKGYGSFLIEVARAFAFSLNNSGIACKFITVDADIEYDPDTTVFYRKNGFVENLANKSRKNTCTVSMRLDIFQD
jgi:hypothetical protein